MTPCHWAKIPTANADVAMAFESRHAPSGKHSKSCRSLKSPVEIRMLDLIERVPL
jgi:hypothetical protein